MAVCAAGCGGGWLCAWCGAVPELWWQRVRLGVAVGGCAWCGAVPELWWQCVRLGVAVGGCVSVVCIVRMYV